MLALSLVERIEELRLIRADPVLDYIVRLYSFLYSAAVAPGPDFALDKSNAVRSPPAKGCRAFLRKYT
jgi:hypothetical protein